MCTCVCIRFWWSRCLTHISGFYVPVLPSFKRHHNQPIWCNNANNDFKKKHQKLKHSIPNSYYYFFCQIYSERNIKHKPIKLTTCKKCDVSDDWSACTCHFIIHTSYSEQLQFSLLLLLLSLICFYKLAFLFCTPARE